MKSLSERRDDEKISMDYKEMSRKQMDSKGQQPVLCVIYTRLAQWIHLHSLGRQTSGNSRLTWST